MPIVDRAVLRRQATKLSLSIPLLTVFPNLPSFRSSGSFPLAGLDFASSLLKLNPTTIKRAVAYYPRSSRFGFLAKWPAASSRCKSMVDLMASTLMTLDDDFVTHSWLTYPSTDLDETPN